MSRPKDSLEPRPYGIQSPGFRIHPAARPGRVRLQVADLDRSLAYYREVLGLRVLERSDGRASLGATGGAPSARSPARSPAPQAAPTPLVELHEKPGVAPVPRRGRLGLFHYAILLPDRAALGSFVEHLAEVGEPSGASDHWVSEALYLQDPDGLGIEVYADRPRSEWRHRGGQLLMATEPLDLDSVVRTAGGASWSGMPAGATMGHLHLHVGDLGRASSFYHEALGLDRVVWSYPGALFLSAGGYHHHLGLNSWAAGAPAAGEDDARLLEWELLIPSPENLEAALQSLKAAGHPVERTTGGARVDDPWGTTLRLRPPPSGGDHIGTPSSTASTPATTT